MKELKGLLPVDKQAEGRVDSAEAIPKASRDRRCISQHSLVAMQVGTLRELAGDAFGTGQLQLHDEHRYGNSVNTFFWHPNKPACCTPCGQNVT